MGAGGRCGEQLAGSVVTDRAVVGLLVALGLQFLTAGKLDAADRVLHRAVEIIEAGGYASDRDIVTLHHRLAHLHHARRDHAAAEVHARCALRMRSAVLGSDHVEVAGEGAALGAVLTAAGRYAEAEPLLRTGLAAIAATFGRRSPEWAIIAHDLATLLAATDRTEEALDLLLDVANAKKVTLGPWHASTAATLDEVAGICRGARGDDVDTAFMRPFGIAAHNCDLKNGPTIAGCATCALVEREGCGPSGDR